MSDLNDWIRAETGTDVASERMQAKVRARVERDGLHATAQNLEVSPAVIQGITSGRRVPVHLLEELPARLVALDGLEKQGL